MHTLFSHFSLPNLPSSKRKADGNKLGWRDKKARKRREGGGGCEEGGKYWLCCYFGNRGIAGTNLRSPYASTGVEGESVYRYIFCGDRVLLRVGTGTQRSSELRGRTRSSGAGLDGIVIVDGIVRGYAQLYSLRQSSDGSDGIAANHTQRQDVGIQGKVWTAPETRLH